MPFLSTNVTNNNNIFFSAISELDLDLFTYFSDNNILSGFILSTLSIIFFNHLLKKGSLLPLLLSNLPAILFLIKLLIIVEIEYSIAQYANGTLSL